MKKYVKPCNIGIGKYPPGALIQYGKICYTNTTTHLCANEE